jgi:putative transposase
MRNHFRYFNSSPEVIRLTVMMYIRYPLSPRQVEDLLLGSGPIKWIPTAVVL